VRVLLRRGARRQPLLPPALGLCVDALLLAVAGHDAWQQLLWQVVVLLALLWRVVVLQALLGRVVVLLALLGRVVVLLALLGLGLLGLALQLLLLLGVERHKREVGAAAVAALPRGHVLRLHTHAHLHAAAEAAVDHGRHDGNVPQLAGPV
jgi:heme A synthase